MRILSGTVVSTKMDKTATIVIHRYKAHPKYKKKYRVSKKYHAHDPENKAQIGDKVLILETKPISKLKRWIIVDSAEAKKVSQKALENQIAKTKIRDEFNKLTDVKEITFATRKRKKKAKKHEKEEIKAPEKEKTTQKPNVENNNSSAQSDDKAKSDDKAGQDDKAQTAKS